MSKRSRSSESLRWHATTLYLAGGAISIPGLILPAAGVDVGLTLLAPAGSLLVLAAIVSRGAEAMDSAPNQPLAQRPGFLRVLLAAVGACWIVMGLVQFIRAL